MDTDQTRRPSPVLFAGEGEMAARVNAFDWAQTPLGPVERWPRSLITAVRLLLRSRYPMFLWWGRELTNLYNDGYVPILGSRHPDALGRPGAAIWSDIWPVVGPQAEAVLREGRATWNESVLLLMERYGFTEETYFTFSYSPAPDDEGGVGGVFCACTEDTRRVLGERRLRTLRDLGERSLTEAKTTRHACHAAATTLEENAHDFPFALIYLFDPQANVARLAETVRVPAGREESPREVTLGGPGDVWGFDRAAATGEAFAVDDVEQRFGRLSAGPWTDDWTRSAYVLPLAKPGSRETPGGFLVAGLSPRLALDEDYRSFLELAGAQIATAIGNANAYEEERRRVEALAALDQAKTAFFSNVSHEFRTPLTLMLGPLEEALADGAGLPEAQRQRLEVAHRSSLRLLKLVNALLDFSRIEAGRSQAQYQKEDLAALTAELASVFRSVMEGAGLTLIIECPPLAQPVYVDPEMWEKIVLNLLSNAFKFTFEGVVEVSLREREGFVELAVRDTGTGIPEEELPRVFDRFHRVREARGRTYEGTGIGLSLVQELVKLHGGHVRVESELDRGSTFTVAIPTGNAHLPADRIRERRVGETIARRAQAWTAEAARWAGTDEELPLVAAGGEARILLADDNTDMREYVQRLLSQNGYRVTAVSDGIAAVEAIRESRPDLLLADVMMPRLDGLSLVRRLRENLDTQSLPIILLSARAGEEARVDGVRSGADDYLVKPFTAKELLARVAGRLEIARIRHEAGESLRQSESRYRSLFNSIDEGVSICEAILGPDGRPRDFRYLEVNRVFEAQTGFVNPVGRTALELVPDLEPLWIETYVGVALTGKPARFERRSKAFAGWFDVYVFPFGPPEAHQFGIIFKNITARKEVEERLRFLVALNEALQAIDDPGQLMARTAAMLGEHLRVHRCAYAEVAEDQDHFLITGDYTRETFSIVGEFRMSDFGAEAHRLMLEGKPYVVDDVERDARTTASLDAYHRTAIAAVICVPLHKRGRFAAAMAVHQAVPRRWSAEEIEIVQLVVQRCWESIERARANRELRESEERFRAMADNAPVMTWVTDASGSCTFLSRPWIEFTGLPQERGLGFGWLEPVHPDDREETGEVFRVANEKRAAFRVEYRLRRADGEYRWALDSAAPRIGAGGEFFGYVGSVIDITERKQAEDALRGSADALREADRLKDDFLATLSHELRTPLTSIFGWAQLILSSRSNDDELRIGIEAIARSAKVQSGLIEDVLDISRITTGKMRLDRRPAALRPVIEAAMQTVQPAAEAKQIDLQATFDPDAGVVSIDPDRMQQIVWNLLSNAVKFTPAGGRVDVAVRRGERRVTIEVQDTGPGIRSDFLPLIFQRFRQADSSSRRLHSGLGLGLALTKDLIELHGGRITVESEEGKGALFRVTIPVSAEAAAPTPEAVVPMEGRFRLLAGRRILIVDDDAEVRSIFGATLRRGGAEVMSASSAGEAMNVLDQFAPDVVVTDVAMPGKDGVDLLEEIRAHQRHGKVPVVAVTAKSLDSLRRHDSDAQFTHHLIKPVDLDELVNTVLRATGN